VSEQPSQPQASLVHAPSHTLDVFDPKRFPAVVDWVVSTARGRYEALAACGHSGLLVAGAASYILGIPTIAVRKLSDMAKADGGRRVNAVLNHPVYYAFVDDLLASGETLLHVVEWVERELTCEAACIAGVILYDCSPFSSTTFDALRARVPTLRDVQLHVRSLQFTTRET